MKQESLTTLKLLAIEAAKLNFQDVIEQFAAAKIRTKQCF